MTLRQPRKVDDPADLIPEKDYAKLRGVNIKTTQNERCKGIGLPFYKKGMRVFYHRLDVLDEINASAVATMDVAS